MKKTTIVSLALLSAALIPAIQQLHAATQAMDGVVSETMCGKKHMMQGKTDAQCVQECIKGGSNYVLVVGDKVYTLAGTPQAIAPFVGRQAHVVGSLKDNTITVTTISEAQGGGMSHAMKM